MKIKVKQKQKHVSFISEVVAAHNMQLQATASTATDIKQTVSVINRHLGSKLEIDKANGGHQLVDATTGRTFTGHIKANDFLRFVGGFAAGVAFVKKQDAFAATARSEDDTNHDFTSAVLALAVSDGVDDSFTGADDGVYYACVDFTPEVKTALKEKGFQQADSYSGVIIVFNDGEFSDDVDAAAFNFFASSTEYEGEWTKAEETAGGRVDDSEDSEDAVDETTDDETTEDEEDRTSEDDAADTAVIALLDSGDCPEPDDSAESEDQSQQYSLYKTSGLFLDKLKSIAETCDYCDDMVGVIYWYGKEDNETEFSESVTWYSDEDLMKSDWDDITGASAEE